MIAATDSLFDPIRMASTDAVADFGRDSDRASEDAAGESQPDDSMTADTRAEVCGQSTSRTDSDLTAKQRAECGTKHLTRVRELDLSAHQVRVQFALRAGHCDDQLFSLRR